MNRLRPVGAAALLVLVVVGTPIALALWGVSPGAVLNLLRPDDGSALLGVLTLLGWVAWAAFAASVVVEAVNVIGRRAVPLRVPLLGGLQSVAGALVFAALSPALPVGAAPPAVVTAHPAAGAAAVVEEQARPADPAAGDEAQSGSDEVPGYLVRAGDDLWSIAEQELGDGHQWRAIAEANPELLANPTVDLQPGSRLRMPVQERSDATHAQAAKGKTVTVTRGDTLSDLAEEHLGAKGRWPKIYRANTDQIKDPDLIDVGWKLVIPFRAKAEPKAQSAPPRKVAPAQTDERRTGLQAPETKTSAAPTPTSAAPVIPEPVPSEQPQAAQAEPDPAWPLLGGLGGVAAAMMLAGLGANRFGQLRARALGTRIAHPPVDVRRYETALGHRERPDSTTLLEKALRLLGAHIHRTGRTLPALDKVTLDDVGAVFHWRGPAGEPPVGFQASGQTWLISARTADQLPDSDQPVPFPALVTLGRDQAGAWVMVDLETRLPLALTGARALRHAVVAALAVELSCSPWAAELSLTVVGGDEMFVRAACPELVRFESDPMVAVDALDALVEERSADESPTALLRVDPDRAEAGAAHIVLFADELDAELRARLAGLLDPDLGLGVTVAGEGESALLLTGTETNPEATVEPDGLSINPQLIAAHTRAAIGTIFAATADSAGEPAPWWSPAEPDNVLTLPRRDTEPVLVNEADPEPPNHPYLMLFGPIDLLGAAGPAPARSRRQCEEYCAWLLENPGSTATRMTTELVVAETTRRSNMSRLRSWLGADADGQAYLPEAYSGRIRLHAEVGSDWQRLQQVVAPGLNRLSPQTLVSALELVRGAPLADAAPGQWRWAEELRTDMASVARDAGVLLTRWAIEHRDIDLARWAASRALLASPEDELLLVERINTEHLAGNTVEVQRLVRWVTGQARVLGMDLAPETVVVCQRAMEGRTRATL